MSREAQLKLQRASQAEADEPDERRSDGGAQPSTALSLPLKKRTQDKLNIKEAREHPDRGPLRFKVVKSASSSTLAVQAPIAEGADRGNVSVDRRAWAKTSLAKSIARATGRRLRLSLAA